MTDQQKRAWRTGGVYALFGALWIVLSDRLLLLFVPDTADYSRLQTWKGWFFIAVTALLVTGLVRRALERQADLLRRARESENRLRAIFDGVGDTIFLLDPGTGRIIEASAMARQHWGYEPGELRGLGLGHLGAGMPPWTDAEALEWIRRAGAGEATDCQWLARRRDGSLFWVELRLRRGDLGGQHVVLALVHDISERRAAEEALRASEARLRTVTEHAPAIIAEVDRDSRLLYISQLPPGMSQERMLGTTIDTWTKPEHRERAWGALRQVLASGESQEFEVLSDVGNGELRWFHSRMAPVAVEGEIRSVVMVSQDITARREAEEALRRSEAHFRGLWEQASVGVALINARERRVEGANLRFAELTGYAPAELEGLGLGELIPPEDIEADRMRMRQLALGEIDDLQMEHRLRRKDGRMVWADITISPLSGPGGPPETFIAVFHDVTARRQAERALRESEERYRLLFDSNPHPMWVFDRDSLAFLAVNDAAVERYGWSRAEFLAMRVTDIRPPEDVPALLEAVQSHSDGRHEAGLWRHRRRDGGELLVEVTSHRLDFALHRAELVLAVDVTAREQTRIALEECGRALRESERRVQDLAAALDGALAGGAKTREAAPSEAPGAAADDPTGSR